jgi:hypothetical protein
MYLLSVSTPDGIKKLEVITLQEIFEEVQKIHPTITMDDVHLLNHDWRTKARLEELKKLVPSFEHKIHRFKFHVKTRTATVHFYDEQPVSKRKYKKKQKVEEIKTEA